MSRATEAECQRTIVDAARLCGWLVYHNRPSEGRRGWRTALQGHAGFPDLVLVHALAGHIWFVELKRKPNHLSPEQLRWADDLRKAGADYRLVWVPDELLDFVQLLADASRPGAVITPFDQDIPRPTTTVVLYDPGLRP